MATASRTGVKREALNLRVKPALRSLIDQAAELVGKNRTDFVLEAARRAAESTLLEQTILPLHAKAYAAFVEKLDARLLPNAQLRRTLSRPAPWE